MIVSIVAMEVVAVRWAADHHEDAIRRLADVCVTPYWESMNL